MQYLRLTPVILGSTTFTHSYTSSPTKTNFKNEKSSYKTEIASLKSFSLAYM